MKVHIDKSRCQGHGRCYAVAPALFDADDIGNGVEIGGGVVPAGLEDDARRAIMNCPEQAISVEESR